MTRVQTRFCSICASLLDLWPVFRCRLSVISLAPGTACELSKYGILSYKTRWRTRVIMVRALLYVQIPWIAAAGLMFRGLLPYFDGRIVDLLLIAALYGFPLAAAVAIVRSNLTPWQRLGVAMVQIGLTFAYVVAILPGAQ